MKHLIGWVVCGVIGIAGCGGDDTENCVDLCTEAQTGNCTSITGSCSAFCTAIDNVQDDSGCADERETYQSCLNGTANVCDNNCAAAETSLGNCIGVYCATHQTNADCQVLANSF
jgi:hypothetical protein